jgi:hypothetical protein
MHLSSRTDIDAPLAFVHAALTDFDHWERAGMRRGADISRTDTLRTPGIGMSWLVKFPFRGKERVVNLRLVALEPEAKLGFSGKGKMLEGDMSADLLALSPKRTRLVLHMDVRPLTIGGRLLLQSAKLAKARVQGRLDSRLRSLAADLEGRYASARRA